MNIINEPNIPRQIKGGSHDTVSMYCTDSVESAKEYYQKLEARLKAINEWHTFSNKVKAEFTMFEGTTNRPTDRLEKGNLVRINVPGIGNPSGNGYDWTEITDIRTSGGERPLPFFSMTLRPCSAPGDLEKTVAHFYSGDSTNTFVIRRVGSCIYAEVHGRNETENTSEVPVLDTVRNKVVAVGGLLGLGKMNWQGFTEALLQPFK